MKSTRTHSPLRSARTKLIASFLLVVALAAVVGFVGLSRLSQLRSDSHRISQQDVIPLADAANLLYHTQTYILWSAAGALNPSYAAIVPKQLKTELAGIQSSIANLAKDQMPNASVQQEANKTVKQFQAFLPELQQQFSDSASLRSGSVNSKGTQDVTAGLASATTLENSVAKAASTVDHHSASVYSDARTILIAVLVVAIVLGIALALILSEQVVRPLRKTVEVCKQLAGGDLTSRLKFQRSDEFGEMATALNSSISSLHDVVKQVEEDANSLTDHAAKASEQTRLLGQAIESQAGQTPAGTTELVSETQATAESLADMAENLHTMISMFMTEASKESA